MQAQASLSSTNDHKHRKTRVRRAEEYTMTSRVYDGMKRWSHCGDGYRIDGAVLKSYPFLKSETYLPYENCYITFQARRSNNLMRVRILTLDINDIQGGIKCLDSLRFYKSPYITEKDKLNSVECGQLNESQNFSFISTTGIVTAHFSTDGGNVNGLGFRVVLTSFRYPNNSYPCNLTDDEFLCSNGECISSLLLCDGIPHCLDGSDERSNQSIIHVHIESDKNQLLHKYYQWRGILIIAFFLIIVIVFIIFTIYFLCRHYCLNSDEILTKQTKNIHSTIVNLPVSGRKNGATTGTTRVMIQNNKNYKHFHDNHNLL